MGRTILCPHCQSSLNEDILKQRNSENICLVCGKPLDNGNGENVDDHADWITWYYYGVKDSSRACLKNHSRHLHAPLCVIFAPHSVDVARYDSFIWHKSPTNCDAHLAESIFQTRSSAWLLDKPIDIGERYYLIKEFKAPPKDANGNCDAAKQELRKYVPDAFPEKKSVPKVQCPYCHSTEIQMVPKKFSLLTGFLTNGYNRVCVRCQRKF